MNKEDAIKILKTNIYRKLCREWLVLQSPIIAIIIGSIIVTYVLTNLFPVPRITLPSSPMKDENVNPAIFTGTITATSILIGFFAASAYNFRQWLETKVDEYIDRFFEFSNFYNKAVEKKVELEKLEKETKKIKLLEEIAKKKIEIIAEIENWAELKELAGLNRDAYAHQQEHLSKFLFNYLAVSFILLLGEILTFFSTQLASGLIVIFVDWTFISLNGVFNGLLVFMREFMTFHVHKEMT